MHFGTKNTLNNNYNHILKHALNQTNLYYDTQLTTT